MSIKLIPIFVLIFTTACSQPPVVSKTTNAGSETAHPLPGRGGSPNGEPGWVASTTTPKIIPAAERIDQYIPLLKGKKVAVFANNTSMVQNTHLVDTLLKLKIDVKKIFGPEHGFRGKADAGEKVNNAKDPETGITIVSLYGKKRKPSAEDLADVDVILFDIQDVGVRFFTYISSLEDLSETAIEYHKPLIVLDRPNPNGFYVDGPMLKKGFRSFLGMQKVPIVYGMTIGEYALMLKGENWIDSSIRKKGELDLKVIPCGNYSHSSKYSLPVKPSPNLPDMASVYLYPSTCFFEGTVLSEGRGTDRPFQVFGHPLLPDTLYSFTPHSREGAKNPKLVNQLCFGWDEGGSSEQVLKKVHSRIQLTWLLRAYQLFPGKDSFFINKGANFNRLAGNDILIQQVKNGFSEDLIRESWKAELDDFKKIRKKYLLYKDFE
ncbi:MAG: DUF1343 domain-containing protein [Chitinophagaceae bacterium]|nr:DUF1343 domain-containing protein [Chitinophagaceae bacterium]